MLSQQQQKKGKPGVSRSLILWVFAVYLVKRGRCESNWIQKGKKLSCERVSARKELEADAHTNVSGLFQVHVCLDSSWASSIESERVYRQWNGTRRRFYWKRVRDYSSGGGEEKKNTFLGSGIFLSGFDGTTLIFVSVFGLIFLNRLSLFFFWDPFSLTV